MANSETKTHYECHNVIYCQNLFYGNQCGSECINGPLSPFFSHHCSQLIIIDTNMTFIDTNRYINKDASFVNKIVWRSHIIVKPGIREKILLWLLLQQPIYFSRVNSSDFSQHFNAIEFIHIKCRAHEVQTKYFRNFRKLVSDIPIFSCNDEWPYTFRNG